MISRSSLYPDVPVEAMFIKENGKDIIDTKVVKNVPSMS